MAKRPSMIGGLTLPSEPAAEAAITPDPVAEDARSAPPKRRVRPEIVHTSVYLPRKVHRLLKDIAHTRDVKIHDVIMEGIDEALRKHGHPTVEALKVGRKVGG